MSTEKPAWSRWFVLLALGALKCTPAPVSTGNTGGAPDVGGSGGAPDTGNGGSSPTGGGGGAAGVTVGGSGGATEIFPVWDESTGLGRPELLYDFGRNNLSNGLRAIVADETHLYWLPDAKHLTRAPKVPGAGAPEIVVRDASPTNANQGWVMEKEFLYWDDATRIRRFEKRTGTVTDFPLDRAYGTLVLVSDETNLYLAEPGCVSMMTMNKQTGALSDIERMDPNSYQGGPFSIAIGNGCVYCSGGKGGVLYRRATSGGAIVEAFQLPKDHPDGYEPAVGSMTMLGDELFLIRKYVSEQRPSHFLSKIALGGGAPGPLMDLSSRIPILSGVLEYDASREILYWASARSLLKYSIATGELQQSRADVFTLDNHPHGSYLAQDEEFLYWHTHDPNVRIFRQRKLDPKLR